MKYLQLVCHNCGTVWDYYVEEELHSHTIGAPIPYCFCPKCGSIGYIDRYAYTSNKKENIK